MSNNENDINPETQAEPSEPVVSDDNAEAREIVENMPAPSQPAKQVEKPVPEKKKTAKPEKSKPADTRAAKAFGRGLKEFLHIMGFGDSPAAEDAASGFTNECLELVDDEHSARVVRIALTGVALGMVLIPVALKVIAPDRLPAPHNGGDDANR